MAVNVRLTASQLAEIEPVRGCQRCEKFFIDQRKIRRILQKFRDLILIFASQKGTGHIGQHTARRDVPRRFLQDPGLQRGYIREIIGHQSPFGVGRTPPGATTRTRDIGHDQIEATQHPARGYQINPHARPGGPRR